MGRIARSLLPLQAPRASLGSGLGSRVAPLGWIPLLGLLTLVGCGEPPEPPVDEAAPPPAPVVEFQAPPSVSGDLILQEGQLRFQACGQEDGQPVDDETGGEARQVLDQLGYGTDRVRVAVVLEGARLLEVRHAHPETQECRELLPDADVEARGNEPFWNLRVTGTEALWRTPEEMEGITYHDGEWGRSDDGEMSFEARRDGVDGVEYLRLSVTAERCMDSMAGSWFPFSAALELGGRSWEGCAVEGVRAFAQP
jgi:uncharacterized membrane protein